MSLSTSSKRLLNTSRDGDSTTSLGSLFQCLITLSVKKNFLISSLNLPWRNLRPFPLVLSLVTWEETDPHLTTASFQPLLIRLLLQTLHQLRCPSLDTLQHLNVSLVVRGPKLNTVFEVRPHQCRVQGHDHFPSPAGHTIPDTSQDAIGSCSGSKNGWRLNHFPGQPVPMLDNPFSEVKFPNTQSKPPLVQLEAISSCPITYYLGEETNTHLATASFQVVVESNKVSPQPLLLQTKQPQFPQPLLIRLLLQTLHQLYCPSLDMLRHLNIPLVVRGPKLNTVFKVRPHQC
ncbi:hypothetical protein QYF61_008310 [Mycteria americana]|uniref:Uncharacterized protein n=1 Tax=Mycteria americana TaxID=33587 RepID=A0AAN7RX75_MYCAM|nr:hypothetical protein QYF61_008310 [Mycteria americana]